MSDQNDLRPGCGSKAGLLLALVLALIVAAVAYWAWSKHSAGAPTPATTSNPPVPPAT